VGTDEPEIAAVMAALVDPIRRRTVELLSTAPRRAGELAGDLRVAPPAMSKHLRVLLKAGIVADERLAEDARVRVFRLRQEAVVPLRSWLDQVQANWDEQLGAFQAHVEGKARPWSGQRTSA
jgi:DNA-binding transcriptional ArsR family regulator